MNRRKTGTAGEELAVRFLSGRGAKITDRNFHAGRTGEIDLIGMDGDILFFAEVKYRSGLKSGYPEEAVTPAKQQTIRRVAARYMYIKRIPPDVPVRFDVVSVMRIDEKQVRVRWIRNAF